MIGNIGFSASIGATLGYCMEDKRVTRRQRREQGPAEVVYKDRAEIIYYNQCYGNRQALVRQFEEVQRLNFNIAKPYLHLALSMAPGDAVSRGRLVDLSRDCAKALDFEDHQYVAILHKDTNNVHMHLVVNRVGFDRHTVVNQYLLRKMNSYCREAEHRYGLTRTPAMRWYRTREERQVPSQDQRVIRLKAVVEQTLGKACDFDTFKRRLNEEGYVLYKTERGIAFKDADNVVTRGYEMDHSWKKIEARLSANEELRQKQAQRLVQRQEPDERRRRRVPRHEF